MKFEEFEREWLKRHKGTIERPQRISLWGLIFSIFIWSVIAIGASLVSGAHSVPAILFTIPSVVLSPAREYLSLFGFTIFELLIFAGAMFRHDSHFAEKGLILAIVGALAANEGSSVYATIQNGGSWLDLIVAVILGLIAPLAAFLAGEMIRIQKQKYDEKVDNAKAAHAAHKKKLSAVINREYTKFMKQNTPSPVVHEISVKSGEDNPSPKRRVKLHEVAREVHENGDIEMTAVDMMEKYGISLGATTKIRDILRGVNRNDVMQ